jgi:hypothetical protein
MKQSTDIKRLLGKEAGELQRRSGSWRTAHSDEIGGVAGGFDQS